MTLTDAQWDEFALMGDVNRDGYINDADVEIINAAYGSTEGTPNWNPAADLDGNGTVNIFDVEICAANYGKNIWDYFGVEQVIVFKRAAVQRLYDFAESRGFTRLADLLKNLFAWGYV